MGKLTQRREAPDAATYLGKGKVEELSRLAHAEMADVIIFDNDLSPGQTRNLEKATGVKVLDRTELILDIFANRAKTHEARLAVELAQLEYSDAAAEADVDAPLAAGPGRRRPARAGREAVGSRPPPGREAGRRPPQAAARHRAAAASAKWPRGGHR